MSTHPTTLFIDAGSGNGPAGWLRGSIVAAARPQLHARFERWTAEDAPASGAEYKIYSSRERGGALFEETARVDAMTTEEDGAVILTLTPTSEAVIFDRRAVRRIDCHERGLFADIDDDIGCRVLDFSGTGFSVHSRQRHVPGALTELSLHYAGKVLCGRGAVTSATPAQGGGTRYGVHVLTMPGSKLMAAMQNTFEELQAAAPASAQKN